MKNADQWVSTKFEPRGDSWVASGNAEHLGRGSRLIGGLQVKLYSQMLQQYATGRLLDVGCGKVPLYGMYKEQVSETVCVDWPASYHESPYLDQAWDLSEPWPFEPSEFDTLVATDVLEHLPNPVLFWSECGRILRPGGNLVLGVPFLYWLHEQPHDYHRFTEFALRRYAEEAGFEVTFLEPYGSAVHVMLDVSGKLLSRRPILSGMHAFASKVILKTPGVGRIVRKTAALFPLGYGLVCEKLGAPA